MVVVVQASFNRCNRAKLAHKCTPVVGIQWEGLEALLNLQIRAICTNNLLPIHPTTFPHHPNQFLASSVAEGEEEEE